MKQQLCAMEIVPSALETMKDQPYLYSTPLRASGCEPREQPPSSPSGSWSDSGSSTSDPQSPHQLLGSEHANRQRGCLQNVARDHKAYSPAPQQAPKAKRTRSPVQKLQTWSPEQCIALDAEMVGVGQYGQNSSVARVVIVDWDGQVIFDEYIKQNQVVTDYRTFVSGITPSMLENAKMSLRDARKEILRILYGRFLIGHALQNDLRALGISHPWWLIRDTAKYEPFMQTLAQDGTFWPRKLKDLTLEMLGKEIQQYGTPHSPCEDAVSALNLYKLVRVEWEKIMQRKLEKTNQIRAEKRKFQSQQQRQYLQQQQQHAAYYQMHQQQHQMNWYPNQQYA